MLNNITLEVALSHTNGSTIVIGSIATTTRVLEVSLIFPRVPVLRQAPTSASLEFTKFELAAASLSASLLLPVGDAFAKGGEFGVIEGRSVALLHPLGMAILFGTTVYAGYLGFQWRRVTKSRVAQTYPDAKSDVALLSDVSGYSASVSNASEAEKGFTGNVLTEKGMLLGCALQLREVGSIISEKKKSLPAAGDDGVRPASPLDSEITSLEQVWNSLYCATRQNV